MEQERRYCTILIKRRVSGEPGPPASLAHGELAVNEVDNTLYVGTTTSSISSENGVVDMGNF